MSERLLVIDGNDLKNLLTVYTDGAVPLDAELIEIAVNAFLKRTIIFTMKSSQWGKTTYDVTTKKLRPLLVRYEGKKTLAWHQNPDEAYEWKDFTKE